MRRLLMMGAMAALTLSAQGALAESRPEGQPPACRQQDRKCPAPPPQGKQAGPGRHDRRDAPPMPRDGDARRDEARPAPGQPRPETRREARNEIRRDAPPAPHVGEDARTGRPWTPPRDSRMAKAPRGQEYRVIAGHLVLVDKKSHRIVSVVAPVRAR
ncbi:hypothetical protein [Paracoccus sp. N5]|uniref:hypothetical protein n=1 Tax=Paracoccus sp. N5 TaxID=1101189 RepID=UPI0003630C94|nr:hypothetical protein [Paracoccus sp. N5]